MKKLLVISEIPVWTISGKAGIEVLYKTVDRFSMEYDTVLIAPGIRPTGTVNPVAFFGIHNSLFSKLSHITLIGYLYKYVYWLLFYRQVKQIVQKENIAFDFLYLVGPMACWAGSKINKENTKVISRHFGVAWNPESHDMLKAKVKFFLKNHGYKQSGDLLIVTDDGTRGEEFFLRLGNDKHKIKFWRNGINKTLSFEEGFRPEFIKANGLKEDVNLLITVSRLASWKKIERVIEALPGVLKEFPDTVLLIVGDGDQKSNLINLAEELSVRQQVIFVGAVERKNLGSYYHMADIFLSMYDYSNAGNPLFEAMQYGKCIVTLNNGDTKQFINDNAGVILDRYTPESLSQAVCSLLGNKDQRNSYGSSAKKLINETFLDWEQRMNLEIETINSVVR